MNVFPSSLKALVASVLRNPWLVSIAEVFRIAVARIRGKKPILVLQPGKVGSTTLIDSLRSVGVKDVFFLHFLSVRGINEALETYRRTAERPGGAETTIRIPRHLVRSQVWWRALRTPLVREFRVITLVRDPIARHVSDVFENSQLWGLSDRSSGSIDPIRASRLIRTNLASFNEKNDFLCRWFERELQETIGVDVYSHPFDPDQGWQYIRGEGWDLLIIRTENLDAALQDIVPRFVGREEPIPVVRANVGSEKKYSDEYEDAKRHLRLPPEVCERVYDSRLTRHFYTSSEVRRMTARWARPRT